MKETELRGAAICCAVFYCSIDLADCQTWMCSVEQFAAGPQREYPSAPRLAVGAVVLKDACVLLVRRTHAPLAGEWSLPGGVVELGETLRKAIVREIGEETGLMAEPLAVLDTVEKIHRDSTGRVQYHYVLVEFLCTVLPGKLRPASDASDATWAKIEELQESSEFRLSAETLRIVEMGRVQQDSQSRGTRKARRANRNVS